MMPHHRGRHNRYLLLIHFIAVQCVEMDKLCVRD